MKQEIIRRVAENYGITPKEVRCNVGMYWNDIQFQASLMGLILLDVKEFILADNYYHFASAR